MDKSEHTLLVLRAEKKNLEADIRSIEADLQQAVQQERVFQDRECYGDNFRRTAAEAVQFYQRSLNDARLRLSYLRGRIEGVRRQQEADAALVAAYGY